MKVFLMDMDWLKVVSMEYAVIEGGTESGFHMDVVWLWSDGRWCSCMLIDCMWVSCMLIDCMRFSPMIDWFKVAFMGIIWLWSDLRTLHHRRLFLWIWFEWRWLSRTLFGYQGDLRWFYEHCLAMEWFNVVFIGLATEWLNVFFPDIVQPIDWLKMLFITFWSDWRCCLSMEILKVVVLDIVWLWSN